MRTIHNNPNPSRLIEGMRDTGYEFKTAIADIIDNSIVAGAKKIEISIQMDPRGDIRLFIIDDGVGMTEEELVDAMQYGASKKNHPLSLGKFGLGLKTASTAFCRELDVITTDSKGNSYKAVWDLDHVVATNEWQLRIGEPTNKEIEMLRSHTTGHSGTMVVWKKVDRLLKKYRIPGGAAANNALQRLIDDLKRHLGLVFQRFIDKEDIRVKNKLKISVNKEDIEPWNPFKHGNLSVEDSPEVTEEVNGKSIPVGKFHIRAFLFPRADEMPNEADYVDLSLQKQGIYIYRENRVIHGPDWLGALTKHNSLNRVRVEFSFDHKLDDLFQIDVKKSQVTLTEELSDYTFSKFLKGLLNQAQKESDRSKKTKFQKDNTALHDPSNVSLKRKEAEVASSRVSLDEETGKAKVHNPHGEIPIKVIHISAPNRPGENFIQPVDTIVDGLLWDSALIDKHNAVRLNTSHEYYQRVYSQIKDNPDAVKGLDYLLWALMQAELNAMNEQAQQYISDYRYEVSRILRKLASDLPEPESE